MHISEFETFFKKAGVKFWEVVLTPEMQAESLIMFPLTTHTFINIGPIQFLFTEAGNFIGTFCEDLAHFEPKIEVV